LRQVETRVLQGATAYYHIIIKIIPTLDGLRYDNLPFSEGSPATKDTSRYWNICFFAWAPNCNSQIPIREKGYIKRSDTRIYGADFLKKLITFAACLLISGCAEYKTAKPSDVTFNSKRQSDIRGYHAMPVRAFLGSATAEKEITGVPCDLIGSGFQARVFTPSAVNVPVYGLRSKAIYVKCTYNGQEKDRSFSPVNITENKAMANGASAGLLGVIVVGAVVAGRKNKDQDEYGYTAAQMIFKKGASTE
jgi:hypothetical protein